MADKYIELNGGALQEKEAITSSAGAGDTGKIPALDGAGRLDTSMMPVGIGADTATIEASETLAAGDMVNIHDATGRRVRKADASNGREIHGFVLSAVTSGQNGTVYFEGTITGLSGLTIGAKYFLSASTAGEIVATAPSGSGELVQRAGTAISATELSFEPADPITLA